MTIKGKRAKALRRATETEAQAIGHSQSGFLDTSFPVDLVHAELHDTEIDLQAFDAFFGQCIGEYRFATQHPRPSVSFQLAHLGETMDVIEELRLRLGHVPADVHATAEALSWEERAEFFSQLVARVDSDLQAVADILRTAGQSVRAHPSKTGRPRKSRRNALLGTVADWLHRAGAGKTDAAARAAAILRAAGVGASEDPKTAARIAHRAARSEGVKTARN